MFMSSSDVIYIPDRNKDFASRDKETILALVSLENSYITNLQYIDYINGLPKKVRAVVHFYVKDRKKIRDLNLYATTSRKPHIYTSIFSGVVAVPVMIFSSFQFSNMFFLSESIFPFVLNMH